MKLFRCPGCNRELVHGSGCVVVTCGCGMLMKKVAEGEHIQPMENYSPDIIFKGDGWPSKDFKKDTNNERFAENEKTKGIFGKKR